MRQSPARKSAPVSQSWIPIESLESLPEMEELLDSSLLVDSGQSRAVRKGSVTRPISPALDQLIWLKQSRLRISKSMKPESEAIDVGTQSGGLFISSEKPEYKRFSSLY